ncbi:isochorismate synthase MenF [Antrihabitans sp. NCIMB 15449]|uniref:isochorismate synthase n=1 Tax=Antrihabitans spumae TaxID=3373370 RepID=A0ABW7JPH4_9NOCA
MDGFLLARTDQVVRTTGARERFTEVDAAAASLRAGRVPLIVGALAFDPSRGGVLTAPESATFTPVRWQTDGTLAELPPSRIIRENPSPAAHMTRVARLIGSIDAGRISKVVAARSVTVEADTPIDPELLVSHLVRRHPNGNVFAVDLDDSVLGSSTLIGASPEVLVSRHGNAVRLRPLAGTAPRRKDPIADRAEADGLLSSTKNQHEHSFVIDWIRERLGPVCAELTIPDRPILLSTPEVWHLETPIHGVLRENATTALDVAALLHPTPAVCGTPTDVALATIADVEGDRRFYGGAVGWCNADGDGDWIVAIRCAELAGDSRTLEAYAGGGIVAGSDPQSELDETTTKLGTLLGALGVRLEDTSKAGAAEGDTLTEAMQERRNVGEPR